MQRLFSDLVRFETELWNSIDRRLRTDFGLPMSRFEPMQVIDRLGSCRVYDIARELSITVGGTSKLVDRIEASGYCVRRPNPGDRRSSIIALTAAVGEHPREAPHRRGTHRHQRKRDLDDAHHAGDRVGRALGRPTPSQSEQFP